MNEPSRRLLRDLAPPLIAVLERLLKEFGETDLEAQVGEISIAERHEHEHGCDYYVVPRSDKPWGPGHRTLGLLPGALHVDVLDNKIVCIEILRGPLGYSPDIETV